MRVAIDGRTLQAKPPGGVGRSLAALVDGMAGSIAIDLLVDRRLPDPEPGARWVRQQPPTAADRGVEVHRLGAPAGGGAPWLQWAAPRWLRKGKAELFHCPFYGLPFQQPVPMVVSIFDLSFQSHPEWFSSRQRAAFVLQAAHAVRTARVVFTGSEHVAGEIEAHLGVDRSRLAVAPPEPSPAFRSAVERNAADPGRLTSPGRPYLLALGGATRRRLAVAVAAWLEARRRGADLDLVVVGMERPAEQHEGLRWAGAVDDREWADLLGGARAFLYPTAYEGFGLPALEAALAGTPVVAAPVGALPEVLGDAAAWVDRPSTTPMADAVCELATDPARRDEISQASILQAQTWTRRAGGPTGAVAVTLAGYRAALEKS